MPRNGGISSASHCIVFADAFHVTPTSDFTTGASRNCLVCELAGASKTIKLRTKQMTIFFQVGTDVPDERCFACNPIRDYLLHGLLLCVLRSCNIIRLVPELCFRHSPGLHATRSMKEICV